MRRRGSNDPFRLVILGPDEPLGLIALEAAVPWQDGPAIAAATHAVAAAHPEVAARLEDLAAGMDDSVRHRAVNG